LVDSVDKRFLSPDRCERNSVLMLSNQENSTVGSNVWNGTDVMVALGFEQGETHVFMLLL